MHLNRVLSCILAKMWGWAIFTMEIMLKFEYNHTKLTYLLTPNPQAMYHYYLRHYYKNSTLEPFNKVHCPCL
ncbi:hypothetical protein SAMN05421766_103331 [Zobellia uliginosa]|uniref:Uncharacterized protein n=1 Tax=Zobellia uliginosa TaxID=143224 RepID=A0ABY1KR68_9FLAO|nr:hypothetical protein SAMN05421766_103331 [Zobellia uliginosa]